MNRQECRTKRINSVCAVTWIPLCARDGSVIKWGRGEGGTLSIHVVWTQCALGLSGMVRCSVLLLFIDILFLDSTEFVYIVE